MPNRCKNGLIIEGEGAKEFLEKCKGYSAKYVLFEMEKEFYKKFSPTDLEEEQKIVDFTFNALVPVPKDVLEAGYNNKGYDWQIGNWGTKWDLNTDGIHGLYNEHEEDCVELAFDTAWSPPEKWVESVSKLFPHLKFTLGYFEPGCFFVGQTVYKNGDIIEKRYYEEDCQEFWDLAYELFGHRREDWYSDDSESEVS